MKIAISGAGIAGPTLAYWLWRGGHEPTLIEKAPRFRTGGYIIDFWGLGYTIAERMGLATQLQTAGYLVDEVRLVGRNGQKVGGFEADVFRRATGGKFISLPRGDLAALIYSAIDGEVETIFGDSVAAIDERATNVHVGFEGGPSRSFDLVIGAGGLHSPVRRLVFGPEASFERDLGYRVAAFRGSRLSAPRRTRLRYLRYTGTDGRAVCDARRPHNVSVRFCRRTHGRPGPS
jgi:2-polyprenyl-6-methoxyphenol hydroxylase-like FAD-dependent oxidoreductase